MISSLTVFRLALKEKAKLKNSLHVIKVTVMCRNITLGLLTSHRTQTDHYKRQSAAYQTSETQPQNPSVKVLFVLKEKGSETPEYRLTGPVSPTEHITFSHL